LAVQALIYSLIFLSITLITGIGGMVSLAQSAFVGAGGLFAGMFLQTFGLPWIVALICAVLICVALGVVVALPSLRLNGVALALSTLALAVVCSNLLFQQSWLSNGDQGWTFNPPKVGPFNLGDAKTMAAVLLILIAATVALIANIKRSTTGRQMLAVRNAQAGAASIGISPTAIKLKLFALSAGIAATGGVLLATTQGNITNQSVVGCICVARGSASRRRHFGRLLDGFLARPLERRLYSTVRHSLVGRNAGRGDHDDTIRIGCN
jgi:ABC-type branched-subunit amino acid transport system permease subunit